MLSDQEAIKRLRAAADPRRPQAVAAAARRLPGPAHDVCRRLYAAAGLSVAQRVAVGPANVAALAALDGELRRRLFATLFPDLHPAVEQAYQMIGQGVYEVSGYRGSFRAPGRPELFEEARWNWLAAVALRLGPFDADAPWLATWAVWLGDEYALGTLLAACIDVGGEDGEQVLRTLAECAAGAHPIGGMGLHVVRALSVCARPEAWQIVAHALLACQRDEVHRGDILDRVDEGHPLAFAHVLRTVIDHGLCRFKPVRQRVDRWLHYGHDAFTQREAESALERLWRYLTDAGAREAALVGEDAVELDLALWVEAYLDAPEGIRRAVALLSAPRPEQRLAAVMTLRLASLPECVRLLVPALADGDVHVAMAAAHFVTHHADGTIREFFSRLNGQRRVDLAGPELFERVAALLPRVPRSKTTLPALLYPWWTIDVSAGDLTPALFAARGDRPIERLIASYECMDTGARRRLIGALTSDEAQRPAVRAWLFERLRDRSSSVRIGAVNALGALLAPSEAPAVEALLAQRDAHLRSAALRVLLGQDDGLALASARRLLAGDEPLQRLAGLELLRELAASGREEEACRAAARAYGTAQAESSTDEQAHLAWFGATPEPDYGADNNYGLYTAGDLVKPLAPRRRELNIASPAASALLASLRSLLVEHAGTLVTFEASGQKQTMPLSEAFPYGQALVTVPRDRRSPECFPLMSMWLDWYDRRPAAMRDTDGLELARAVWLWRVPAHRRDVPDLPELLSWWCHQILGWLLALVPPPPESAAELLLAASEAALAVLPRSARGLPMQVCALHYELCPGGWDAERLGRAYRLSLWALEPTSTPVEPTGLLSRLLRGRGGHAALTATEPARDDAWRYNAPLNLLLGAMATGAVGDADLVARLLHYDPRGASTWTALGADFESPYLAKEAVYQAAEQRLAERLLTVELARGDRPTPVSARLHAMDVIVGVGNALRLLAGLGKEGPRGLTDYGATRGGALTSLLRKTRPAAAETPAACAERIRAAGLAEGVLCQAALVAPQWSEHIAAALDWPGFVSGVAWLLGHAGQWGPCRVPEAVEAWADTPSRHTELSADERQDGAVDVAWFAEMHQTLGAKRFDLLYKAAKPCPRARLFADAILGRVGLAELSARVADRRSQDALRAFGLAPLPDGQDRSAELLARYQTIIAFERTARQFGPQRRDSERLAAAVALGNLARTAGYSDAVRLRWAMEDHAVADLQAGPVVVSVGDVTVTLSLTDDAQPELGAAKAGKALASIPARLGKEPAVVALRARRAELLATAERMRTSLEAAMCRGDGFTGGELGELLGNPMLAPALSRLVWRGDDAMGYLAEGARVLRDHGGGLQALGHEEVVRIAHPADLLAAGDWHLWQRECFAAQRVQPFRQVFRELYTLTAGEREDGEVSRRYAGHELQPRQAVALLVGRGWARDPDGGYRRTWHDVLLSAVVTFEQPFFSPAELDGLTLAGVHFARRGDWRQVPLADAPPRVFSEAMRDLDLVVSVAHRGPANPDATLSTMAMRAALVRETSALMGLANVRVEGALVLVDGQLGSYTVHLGSAHAHRRDGGMLPIVPAAQGRRGTPWLPFADDDPRTAEVLSKVILLARDQDICDPALLAMLRGPTSLEL
ncbi:MAG: DUF4132 domain-containing protein [Armatimonadetes bacterium]|nr:DUF4132 domain-containing protein [Armatimonadota bacterium]